MQNQTWFGDYFLVEKIATGGMAEIHLAIKRDREQFRKLVALKRIIPRRREDDLIRKMFYNEAGISSFFQHPNLVELYDVCLIDEIPTMVMEFVDGVPLTDLVSRLAEKGRSFPRAAALKIIIESCDGLHHAHQLTDLRGKSLEIIHRDVSPQNIQISFKGQVKVLDFGVARASESVSDELPGVLAGKYAYMSPEQCRGEDLDPRSDLFSLGVILYELSTNKRLFRRETHAAAMKAVLKDPIPRPSDSNRGFPRVLERIIMSVLERAREQRMDSARELSSSLQRYASVAGEIMSSEALGEFVSELYAEKIEQDREKVRRALDVMRAYTTKEGVEAVQSENVGTTEQYRLRGSGSEEAQLELGTLAARTLSRESQSESASTIRELQGLDRLKQQNRVLRYIVLAVLIIGGSLGLKNLGLFSGGEDPPAVFMESTPSGAVVSVDGVELAETTPTRFSVNAGELSQIQVSAPGYQMYTTVIGEMGKGEERFMDVVLSPLSLGGGQGVIRVVTEPAEVNVSLNGVSLGEVTPLTVEEIPIGADHLLQIEAPDFRSKVVQFRLASAELREFNVTLIPNTEIGWITLRTVPEGAAITIDGHLTGDAPLEEFELISGVTHQLTAALSGYELLREEVEITGNNTTELELVLTPVNREEDSTSSQEEGAGENSYPLLPE